MVLLPRRSRNSGPPVPATGEALRIYCTTAWTLVSDNGVPLPSANSRRGLAQRSYVRRRSRCQAIEAVPALEHRNHATLGVTVRDAHHGARQVRKILVGEREPAQQIADARIEAGRDED